MTRSAPAAFRTRRCHVVGPNEQLCAVYSPQTPAESLEIASPATSRRDTSRSSVSQLDTVQPGTGRCLLRPRGQFISAREREGSTSCGRGFTCNMDSNSVFYPVDASTTTIPRGNYVPRPLCRVEVRGGKQDYTGTRRVARGVDLRR